jgi:two-component system, NarL family, response regulator LiaR
MPSSFSCTAAIRRKVAAVSKNRCNYMTGRTRRVLIVDDDAKFAELLDVVFGDDPRLTVVGRAGDGATGLELALRLRPDVVVMDVEMPVLDGFAAACRIRRQLPTTRVVFVTGAADASFTARARAAGAAAFFRKGCELQNLLDAVAASARPMHAARWSPLLPAA